MDQEKAREEVILAGKTLAQSGLIVRTWGNVSCRVDEKRFAITPSGLPYETLRPRDIVVVNIADLSYEGGVKPSSEKGIHAGVYASMPNVNFLIHTHQEHASVACALGKDVDIADPRNREIIGETAVMAGYGLPGTKKLQGNVMRALARMNSRAVLMAHHGALCLGEGREEAFAVAQALEDECRRYLPTQGPPALRKPASSRRSGGKLVFESPEAAMTLDIAVDTADIPFEARLHQAIYRARRDIGVIMGSSLPYTLKVSGECGVIKPLLDDFAQIVGVSVAAVGLKEDDESIRHIVRALKGRNAVLLKGLGALCCAGGRDDAAAVEMVLEKGCMTYLSAVAHDALKPIAPIECALMRQIYLHKYAKKAQG